MAYESSQQVYITSINTLCICLLCTICKHLWVTVLIIGIITHLVYLIKPITLGRVQYDHIFIDANITKLYIV